MTHSIACDDVLSYRGFDSTCFHITFFFLLMSIRLLYSAKEPVSVLVFEDMTMHGFGVSAGTLNFEGTKFVASKLAKFHATSFYMGKDVR